MTRLQEVQNAVAAFCFHNSDPKTAEVVSETETIPQAFNSTEFFIMKTIRFAKNFTGFALLQTNDQMNVLKNAFPAIFAVYNSFVFNPDRDGFPLSNVCKKYNVSWTP